VNTRSPIGVATRTVLVVDDDADIRNYIQVALSDKGYQIVFAEDAQQALEQLHKQLPDLILLDIVMPGISGVELLQKLKADPYWCNIPVVMVTAMDDRQAKLDCLKLGVEDFLHKPLDYSELVLRVRNLLRIKSYNELLSDYNATLAQQVAHQTRQVKQRCIETVLTLTRAAEFRDDVTGLHVTRISYYTRELAQHMGMSEAFCDDIFYASPMHDIGKLAIPDHILKKPLPFTAEEWAIMKTHTTLGKQILSGGSSRYLEMGQDIAVAHHERWDGSGYPAGLKAEAIPLAARLMAVCDVYDALRSERPYKPHHSHQQTVSLLKVGDSRTCPEHFDPQILQAFLQIHQRFDEIFQGHHAHPPERKA